MTDTIKPKSRSSRHEKTNSNRPFKKFFLRVALLLLICLIVLTIIGFVKNGNIKKVNDQPKSFPVRIQN